MSGINVFKVYGTLGLDTNEYEKALGNSESKTSDFASKLKSGFKTAAKVGVASLTAVATGVGALAKKSVESYAKYEQLVGGVETLFAGTKKTYQEFFDDLESQGKSLDEINEKWVETNAGQIKVLNNADKAYRTAGLSANQYMETVTSFSASLIQSLEGDTKKAADYADMAIIDMADNANKMGTEISMIQTTYAGFAKQNFTMLDNLEHTGGIAA